MEVAWQLVSGSCGHKVIVRSSAVGEGLDDRGLYRSICLDAGAGIEAAISAIAAIYTHFASHQRHAAIGICMQRYMQPDLAGHVSNETHLSATRNQWKYGLEIPAFAPDRGLNSKFASSLDEVDPIALRSQRDIPQALRRVCNWANLRVDRRSHLEWCGAAGRLWIVQLDQEGPTSAGANPHNMPVVRAPSEDAEPHKKVCSSSIVLRTFGLAQVTERSRLLDRGRPTPAPLVFRAWRRHHKSASPQGRRDTNCGRDRLADRRAGGFADRYP
jgi:hypothetical protein